MLKNPTRDQVIALAGLFQSAMLVHQLATSDDHDESALLSSATSVLRVNADSVFSVYGSADGVRMGCAAVASLFGGRAGQSARPLFQYSVAMHQVARRLPEMTHVSASVHEGLEDLSARYLRQDELEDDSEENANRLYQELAELYARTISTLTPRIMVQGSQGKLSNPLVVNRVRSALFSGIRAAYLWHQLGGRRWHLLFLRRRYQSMADRLARI
jgi:high frequency lysogenization protein